MLRRLGNFAEAKLSLLLCAVLVLGGCNAIRFAIGRIKAPPDEFAIRTFATLAIPPDGSLRLPQPGMPSRNDLAAAVRARIALFSQSIDADMTASADAYSDGEIFLLTKANAAYFPPSVARAPARRGAILSSNDTVSLRRSFDR